MIRTETLELAAIKFRNSGLVWLVLADCRASFGDLLVVRR